MNLIAFADKAMVFNSPHTVVHTGRQHTAKLPCMYDGNPRAEVRWYKGAKEAVGPEIRNRGVRKPPARNGEVSELVIHNPTDKDLGNYTCVVNNSLGTVNASFFVTGNKEFSCFLEGKNHLICNMHADTFPTDVHQHWLVVVVKFFFIYEVIFPAIVH